MTLMNSVTPHDKFIFCAVQYFTQDETPCDHDCSLVLLVELLSLSSLEQLRLSTKMSTQAMPDIFQLVKSKSHFAVFGVRNNAGVRKRTKWNV